MQRHKALHHCFIFTERMVRHIKAQQLLFVLQQRLLGDFRQLRQSYLLHAEGLVITKQSQLAVCSVPLARSAQVYRLVDHCQKLRAACAEGIHSAALDEMLYHALIHHAHIHAAAEIRQACKRPALAARADNRLDSRAAGALDTGKAKTDGFVRQNRKVTAGLVDIRRQNLDIVIFADADIPAQLIAVANDTV